RLGELFPLQIRIHGQPLLKLHELERIGRGGEHLREKRVGIERDRCDQRVELVGWNGSRLLLRRLRRRLGRLTLCLSASKCRTERKYTSRQSDQHLARAEPQPGSCRIHSVFSPAVCPLGSPPKWAHRPRRS